MTGRATFLLLLGVLVAEVVCQHTPNSLQAAIEALHRHHEILSSQQARHHAPLQQQHHPQANDYFSEDNEDYPYGEALQQQGQLNRALADYLSREEERERVPSRYADFEDEDEVEQDGFEARKRSIFRERDEVPHKSVLFRERGQYAPDLGQEFLEEMEREREEEEEDHYRQTLRRLWDKYQQQENSIERQLFEEQNENPDEEDKKKRSFDLDDRKKRYGFLPMYFGPSPVKRRDYPLLPWLDADSRKKRFMVAKRSAKPVPEEANAAGTSLKVSKDLQALFGAPTEDKKKKRSTAVPEDSPHPEKKEVHHVHDHDEEEEEDEQEHEDQHEHEEEGHEHEHEHEPEHEHDDSDEDVDEEERKKKRSVLDEEKKKKKRAATITAVKSSPEVVKEDQIIPGDLSDFKKKKDVRWEKYFGYDRRKKRDWANGKYKSMIRQPLPTTGEEDEKRKKKQVDPEKINSMDDKLKNIEDLIIEETVKYTGAHEGVSNPEEVQKLKDHVISRLATAYSLEKMRRALDRLHENVDSERHLMHNEIEPSDNEEDEDEDKKKKKKRIPVKKDQSKQEAHGHHDNLEEEKKKKQKRNGFSFEDELNENSILGPLDAQMQPERLPDYASASQCPLLNAMEKRCRGVDILSGDIHQELLPICAVHQLCYLCGTSQTSCDLQYLSDADAICGKSNGECESAARSALMILRGAPGPQLGPRECARNSCLYNAIRDIAY